MYVRRGRLEVIAGPMFAGKTEELIRRVRRAAIARRRVQVFTHAVDVRNRLGTISSHTGLEFPSTPAASASDLEVMVEGGTELIGIDEAQFFGPELIPVTDRLAREGIDVVVAGLVVTFTGEPFEPLPALMALAEGVTKLTAVCTVCGADAIYHRKIAGAAAAPQAMVVENVGGLDKYEARCRLHFEIEVHSR
jgi:thymidine kinase